MWVWLQQLSGERTSYYKMGRFIQRNSYRVILIMSLKTKGIFTYDSEADSILFHKLVLNEEKIIIMKGIYMNPERL